MMSLSNGVLLLCSGLLLTACDAAGTSPHAERPDLQLLVTSRVHSASTRHNGVVVELGRLRHSRLEVRGAEVILVPPRSGVPVLDESGAIHPRLIAYLDGAADGQPVG